MRRSWLALMLALCAVLPASAETPHPRMVRVTLGSAASMSELLHSGLDVVHVRGPREALVLAWPRDDERLARFGAGVEVIDADPGRSAATRSRGEIALLPKPVYKQVRSATEADGLFRTLSAPPFGSGSMAGFYTYEEIKMKLDDLVASDVNDVVADKLDTLGYSWQGRPIWGLKIGKRVVGTDTRPVAFFNGLTHAREPESMQVIFYFIDDLLAHYGSDPVATSLLNNRVIYIVPMVNPDGYKYNQDYYTGNGGTAFGFQRKNLRTDALSCIPPGVDLNRNYGFQWNYDDNGSSDLCDDETYRGPGPFSEPETRSQRDIVDQLKPATGISFHTFGDVLIFPWGYETTYSLDDAAFREWSDHLTRDNAYLSGIGPDVLYPVNGEFNDWAYGDTLSKPRMFSWTAELGDDIDGFYPAPSRIVPLAQENLHSCYFVTAIAGAYLQEDGVTLLEGSMNAGQGTHIMVRARNLGRAATAPSLIGKLVPLDAGVHLFVDTANYPAIGSRQSADPNSAFQISLADSITPGRLMRFAVEWTASGGFFSRDTISIPAGTPTMVAFDNASSGLTKWTWSPSPNFGIISGDPNHPSRYFADNPTGFYTNNATDVMRLTAPMNLSAGVHAYAYYEAKWQFEQDYDAALFEASLNGTSWTQLPATGSTPGSGIPGSVQSLGKPYYAGSRNVWSPEMVDLSGFTGPAGTTAQIRFRLRSDQASPFPLAGLAFDSLRVLLYDPAAQPGPTAVGDADPALALALAPPAPNPVHDFARFSFALPRAGDVRLEIIDLQGRRVRVLANGPLAANRYIRGWDARDDGGRPAAPGVYLARLKTSFGTASRRFVVD